MSEILITLEPYSAALLAELLPLAQQCWQDSTEAKGETCAFYGERDFAIEPNDEQYQKLAAIGSLVILTLRDFGALVGYVSGFLYWGLHHKKVLGAAGDSIYVKPDYRAYTGPLIDRFLTELCVRKAQIIGWPTTPGGAVYNLLLARGFVGDDVVMEKRLCA